MMQKVRCRTLPEGHSASTGCKCTVLGSISLSLSEFFSPFPHGTSSLSVIREYLALDGGPPRFPQNFKCSVVLRNILAAFANFAYGTITLFGRAFQLCSTINLGPLYCMPYNHTQASLCILGYSRFARTTQGISFDFSSSGY